MQQGNITVFFIKLYWFIIQLFVKMSQLFQSLYIRYESKNGLLDESG